MICRQTVRRFYGNVQCTCLSRGALATLRTRLSTSVTSYTSGTWKNNIHLSHYHVEKQYVENVFLHCVKCYIYFFDLAQNLHCRFLFGNWGIFSNCILWTHFPKKYVWEDFTVGERNYEIFMLSLCLSNWHAKIYEIRNTCLNYLDFNDKNEYKSQCITHILQRFAVIFLDYV